jgi:hypothetical protein
MLRIAAFLQATWRPLSMIGQAIFNHALIQIICTYFQTRGRRELSNLDRAHQRVLYVRRE